MNENENYNLIMQLTETVNMMNDQIQNLQEENKLLSERVATLEKRFTIGF